MDLCVGVSTDPVVSNDAEALIEGRGDEVLAIGLAELPDGSEDGRRPAPSPGGEHFPGKGLLQPTALEQAAQLSRHQRQAEPSSDRDTWEGHSFPAGGCAAAPALPWGGPRIRQSVYQRE